MPVRHVVVDHPSPHKFKMKKIFKKFTDWQTKYINKIYIEFELNELTMLWICVFLGFYVGLFTHRVL